MTSEIGESNAPVMAWAGESFVVAWWDLRGARPAVHEMRVDQNGTRRSEDREIPSDGPAKDQDVSWDGREVNLVFASGDRVYAARLGATRREPRKVAEDARMPAAGPFGAVVWVEKGALFFRCDGMAEGDPVLVGMGGIEDPRIAWSGERFAVVWSSSVKGGREIRMRFISPRGRPLGKPFIVSGEVAMAREPFVAWTGEKFVVAWTSADVAAEGQKYHFRSHVAIVSPDATAPEVVRDLPVLAAEDRLALASSGKEIAIAWVGSEGPRSVVFFARVGLDGGMLGDPIKVSDDTSLVCSRPTMAWNGSGYAVAWSDDRAATGTEVVFAFLACGEETSATDAGAAETAGVAEGIAAAGAPPALKDVFEESAPAPAPEPVSEKPRKKGKRR